MWRLILLVAMLSAPAMGEVFHYEDENGNPVFTDKPGKGRPVDIDALEPPSLRYEPRIKPLKTDREPPQPTPPDVEYSDFRILAPNAGQVFPAGSGGLVPVSTSITPPPIDGHIVRWKLDGVPTLANGGYLVNVPRGEHQLTAELYDRHRNIVLMQDNVTIQVHRASNRGQPKLDRGSAPMQGNPGNAPQTPKSPSLPR
jgi:hypothetical protein